MGSQQSQQPDEKGVISARRIIGWGRSAWGVVGIALAATIIYMFFSMLSGLVVPLVIAAVIGILAVPLVDYLERVKIPRMLGALIVILGIFAVFFGALVLGVQGVADQSDEITEQVTAGIDLIDEWLTDLDIDIGQAADRYDDVTEMGLDLLPGAASYLTTIFSSVMAFLLGAFLSVFILYYVLADWEQLRDWVGHHLGVGDELGAGIVTDAITVVRQGFYALSLSSLVTAILIGGTMLILDIPLAFTVALVTFVTSYIPYLGAIVSGAFGFLVALGASGLSDALILLVVILIVQNIVQTLVGNRLTSDHLSLHPLAAFFSTLVGASLAGLLGAMLSAPVVALILAVARRVDDAKSLASETAETAGTN